MAAWSSMWADHKKKKTWNHSKEFFLSTMNQKAEENEYRICCKIVSGGKWTTFSYRVRKKTLRRHTKDTSWYHPVARNHTSPRAAFSTKPRSKNENINNSLRMCTMYIKCVIFKLKWKALPTWSWQENPEHWEQLLCHCGDPWTHDSSCSNEAVYWLEETVTWRQDKR